MAIFSLEDLVNHFTRPLTEAEKRSFDELLSPLYEGTAFQRYIWYMEQDQAPESTEDDV